jgi:hypothetical protein
MQAHLALKLPSLALLQRRVVGVSCELAPLPQDASFYGRTTSWTSSNSLVDKRWKQPSAMTARPHKVALSASHSILILPHFRIEAIRRLSRCSFSVRAGELPAPGLDLRTFLLVRAKQPDASGATALTHAQRLRYGLLGEAS